MFVQQCLLLGTKNVLGQNEFRTEFFKREPSNRNLEEELSSKMLSASSNSACGVRSFFKQSVFAGSLVFCLGFCGLAAADTPYRTEAMSNESTLTIRNFVGTITIEEGRVDQIKISERSRGETDDIAYKVGDDGRSITLSGGVPSGNLNCVKQNDELYVRSGDSAPRDIKTYPQIDITIPANTRLDVEVLAGLVRVSDANSLRGVFNGCSDISVANIRGAVDVETNGGSSLSVQGAQRLHLFANGGSHVQVEELRGDGNLSLAGTARLAVNNSNGQLRVSQTGASRLNMKGGSTSNLMLKMSGASRFEHQGLVEKASIKLDRASRAKLEAVRDLQTKELSRTSQLEIGGTRIQGR